MAVNEDDFNRIERLFEKQTEQFQRYLGIVEEKFQHKLDLVVEGQQMLVEMVEVSRAELKQETQKLDYRLTMVEARLERKIDAVATDLSVHRKDTESHGTVYKVKEE
jgi:hypothetical protein